MTGTVRRDRPHLHGVWPGLNTRLSSSPTFRSAEGLQYIAGTGSSKPFGRRVPHGENQDDALYNNSLNIPIKKVTAARGIATTSNINQQPHPARRVEVAEGESVSPLRLAHKQAILGSSHGRWSAARPVGEGKTTADAVGAGTQRPMHA